ncbi:MAG: PAS domain S-box-containing protein [Crocinitomicaceae bacterium]|jgi:PAS domain S-box-containing protein
MNLDTTIFKQIAENNWEPIVFASLDGAVVYANPAAYSLYGYDQGELIGKNVDIFNSQISHDTGHIVRAIIDHGGWSGELIQRKKNNETFNASLTVSLIFDEKGEPVGYASNSKDISQRVGKRKILQDALRSKEILFQEIHHRLKNNLAIISSILELQASKSGDSDFVRAIRDSQRRIKTTALAHEVLYENETLETVDLTNYIENLSNNVFESFVEETSRIKLVKTFNIDTMDVNHAVPLGLILNELMTNSFKYAFPDKREGEIHISILQEGNMIDFKFKDNGIGLPENFQISESNSTGMIVLHSLVEQLDGSISLNSNKGTEIHISFKSN